MNTQKNNRFGGYGYFFAAGVTWGSIGLFVKLMSGAGSTSAWTTFLRLGIACVLMVIFTLIKEGPRAFLTDRKTLLSCFLIALVCQLLYNLSNNAAVSRVGVGCASVLLYISPVFTACACALLFREKITWKKWCILALDVLGCALTAGLARLDSVPDWKGILCGVAAGFCYAMVPVFGRLATGRTKPMVVTAWTFIFSAPLCLVLRPWQGVENPFSVQILLPGFLLALIPTALAYALYYTGMEKVTETSRIPVICSVEPVIATVLGAVIFHEKLYVDTVLGIALVLGSIVLMNRKPKQLPPGGVK